MGRNKMICRICGDKAFAKNFCVISCESCKAFFRRNANLIEELKCVFSDKCEVNIDTRRRCRKCRMDKCLKLGMRKEWILTENERTERNNKIEENRVKRKQTQGIDNYSVSSVSTENDSQITDSSLSQNEFIEETKSKSNDTSIDTSNDIISEFFYSINNEVLIQNEIASNEKDSTQKITTSGTDITDGTRIVMDLVPVVTSLSDWAEHFNELEYRRLSELLDASKHLAFGTNPIVTSETVDLFNAMRVVSYRWDKELPKIIKSAKCLTGFKGLCVDDQLALLKYGLIEMAFLRTVLGFENQSDDEYWMIPIDDFNATILRLEVFKQKSFENYFDTKMFIKNLSSEWEHDHIILNLLLAILLFEPNRPRLIHVQHIRYQQHIYMYLLKRYLQSRYRSQNDLTLKFNRCMNLLAELHRVYDKHLHPELITEPETPYLDSPIIREIYDK